ncbi:unnamed protein product [Rotaria sordida]|uniref:Uncharacterized protein n=1 Tax=Rotaria sordida TaxID=392033 RepID=A0A814VWD5_9BILA|nr:unnamed protein product [Rotaria sordida]CAF1194383.1 unnamed protein product [Rotaria sordida]CAF1226790.1 unnamed protein product [Rotaria sordida]CAF1292236.1 unnamed protein product [Rotaria sordida]CAF1311386.1 unnamed protein product [Rotaria sordida]
MAILTGSSLGTILLIIGVYAMCNVIQVVEGRFLWDLSLYCINYCSRNNSQTSPIGICSCHRIASYNRRMATTEDIQIEPKQDFQYYYSQQPIYNDVP